MMSDECLNTDLTSWEIGPYDRALPGAMRLRLNVDGEIIASSEVETGFLHRGLEKAFEFCSWKTGIIYADRLDPEGAVFGELAFCLAVEEIANIAVPPRAQMIRVVLSELSRISGHMGYIVRIAHAVGSETMVHYVLRDREKLLDLFELVAGARFSLNYLRFGGVKEDITEGFIERLIEACELLRIRLKEYNDLFTFNHAFIKRTEGVGLLSRELIQKFGITGPNARASGVSFDVRKTHPYSGYDRLDFETPGTSELELVSGDANDRFLLRLRELAISIDILKQVAESVPPGEFLNKNGSGTPFIVPPGESYSRIESGRGLLGCHVVSDGGPKPSRVQFRTPTVASLMSVPDLVCGVRIEDLPIVLASLDLSIAEADR